MFSRRILRIKAMQMLYAASVQLKQGIPKARVAQALQEGLTNDVEELRRVHTYLLQMLVAWGDLDAAHEKTMGHSDGRSLATNAFLKQLASHPIFLKQKRNHPLAWSDNLVRTWYTDKLGKAPFFLSYKKGKSADTLRDIACIKRILRTVILSDPEILEHIEEVCLGWPIYQDAFMVFFYRFVQDCVDGMPSGFALYTRSFFAGAQAFYSQLVHGVMTNEARYEAWIRDQSENWDYERMLPLDRILLKMGLAEAFSVQETPKAVIINEYLEVAKVYSGEKSPGFLHGMLDRLIDPSHTSG